MSYNKILAANSSRLLILIPIFLAVLLCCPVMAEEAGTSATDQPLTETDLESLEASLKELKALAPKLRVLLRTLRSQVGFNPREVHLIERGMSQSQKDLERLVAMTKRNAYNGMRAHFLADDLRRKSEGLKASLGYVEQRTLEFDKDPGGSQVDVDQKQNNEALRSLLERYTELVGENVALLQSKGI
jgi:hypothetical protein